MTRITAVYGPEALTLTVRGHAAGSPAACAGVSALVYALEGWAKTGETPSARPTSPDRGGAEQSEAEGFLPLARVTPGAADFRLPRTAETEAAFALTVTGLARIAATVPEAVRIAIMIIG